MQNYKSKIKKRGHPVKSFHANEASRQQTADYRPQITDY